MGICPCYRHAAPPERGVEGYGIDIEDKKQETKSMI